MVVNLRWIKTVSITLQDVDFYGSLVCATIILFWNKNRSIQSLVNMGVSISWHSVTIVTV